MRQAYAFSCRLLIGFAVVFAVGLAGCGAATPSVGANTAIIATATVAPGVATQACGTVHATHGPATPAEAHAAQQAFACLWTAYSHCQPATLTYTVMGVDTFASHAITVAPTAHGCAVTDNLTSTVDVMPTRQLHYTCAGISQTPTGLQISACGEEGNVLLQLPGATG